MTVTDSAHDFRVGVIGAGMMGADHVKRIGSTISGARVSAVVDPDESRVASALENAPGAVGYSRIEDALEDQAIDGVLIATPGFLHEPVLLPCLEAKLPILCEKPLTPDPESSWRILEAEQATGEHLIQVGFMRRFDPEYRQLRDLVDSEDAGELLMLRCAHRNPSVPDSYMQESLINDSVVHEFDVVPWLADSPIVTLEVKHARRNRLTPERLKEPILVLMELANGTLVDLEMNVSIQFGYQVTTEAVFDSGIARIGEPSGLQHGIRAAPASRSTRISPHASPLPMTIRCRPGSMLPARGPLRGPPPGTDTRWPLPARRGSRRCRTAGPAPSISPRLQPSTSEDAS